MASKSWQYEPDMQGKYTIFWRGFAGVFRPEK
jgi:hypothetical protein